MKGCKCGLCDEYKAPELLCKGALLALYIETVKKLRRLEDGAAAAAGGGAV